MPRIKSAIKRVEVAERNRQRNRSWKSAVRTVRTNVADVCKGDDAKQAAEALKEAYSVIDRALSKGVLNKNAAARRKSRLATLVLKQGTAAPKKTTTKAKKTK